jgi:folate-binding protein YgfZ
MSTCSHTLLKNRGLLAVTGEDAVDFLQGLVSNDVSKASSERALYAAMLTPQGKFLYDFFIVQMENSLLLDCEADRLEELKRKLTMYKLRSKVKLNDLSQDFVVAALMGDTVADTLELPPEEGRAKPFMGGLAYMDPRLHKIGARSILPRDSAETFLINAGFDKGTLEDYEKMRLGLGLPDGSRDMIIDKAILLENGFQDLNGVDWDKGCYMGQELTARTHYRGLVKKRLMPVRVEGSLPASGTKIMLGDVKAGEMRTGQGELGLALIRLDQLKAAIDTDSAMSTDEAILHPEKPDWADFKFES